MNTLEKELISFKSDDKNKLLIYSEYILDTATLVKDILTRLRINVSIINVCECNRINQETNIKDIAPADICIITEAQNLQAGYAELISSKIIMLTSNRHFVNQVKKHSECILIDARLDFNNYTSLEKLNTFEQLFIYIVTDAQSKYLNAYKNINNISKYLEHMVFSELSILYNKPIKDIYTVFKAPKMYVSVMYALANGCHNSGDVAEFLDVKQTTISKYLKELEIFGYIGYTTPIDTLKNRRRKYIIKSPYYHFWFRFIYKNLYVLHNKSKVIKDLRTNYIYFALSHGCVYTIKISVAYIIVFIVYIYW